MDNQLYQNLVLYLSNQQLSEELSELQKQQIQKSSKHYRLHYNLLYKVQPKTKQKIRVIRKTELSPVLYMLHYDPTAAHASIDAMMEKLKTRYYWPQMFEDIKNYVQSCDSCQRRKKNKRQEPLHPIPVGDPFYQIGIDYVGPLPRTTRGNRYIIVAMDYLTKWPEAKPVKEATAAETVEFIYEDIICRHGCPQRILTDRGTHFNNKMVKELLEKFRTAHLLSTPYHPQTNGLVERFNRTLAEALARTAAGNLSNWDTYIAPVLFAYRTTRHSTTKLTPFSLLYGREARLPLDNMEIEEESTLVSHIEGQIDELPIKRETAKLMIEKSQIKQKDRHDAKLRNSKQFVEGDKVLYYNAPLDKQWSGKLLPKWKGPYYIHLVIGNGAYKLKELDGRIIKTPVNECYLKLYHERQRTL